MSAATSSGVSTWRRRWLIIPRELVVERRETVAELRRGPHGAKRVVLVHGRDAEDSHHRVPDELLDRAAVSLDDRLRRLKVACHHPPQALRVDPLAERCRARDVAEEDRDCLARLANGRRLGNRRATGVAESRLLPVLRTAAR